MTSAAKNWGRRKPHILRLTIMGHLIQMPMILLTIGGFVLLIVIAGAVTAMQKGNHTATRPPVTKQTISGMTGKPASAGSASADPAPTSSSSKAAATSDHTSTNSKSSVPVNPIAAGSSPSSQPPVPLQPSFTVGASFSGDFHKALSTGNLTAGAAADYATLLEQSPDRMQLVSSPKRRGNYAVMITINQNDTDNNGRTDRDEMTAVGTTWGPGEEVWMAMSYYLDPASPYPSGWEVCAQLFGETGGQSTGSPPFGLEITGSGAFLADVRGGVKANAYAAAPKDTAYWMADATKGVWHDFLFHFKFAKDSSGLIEGWHRVQGGSFTSNPTFTDTGVNVLTVGGVDQRVYMEDGIYRSTMSQSQILYFNGAWMRGSMSDAESFFN